MLLKKEGFPEENELVLCTVTKVQFHSVFVNIDEYDKQGMIHIAEISPGRIRNIRDFVKEGKVLVCKVLRINKERGYIDLSLRRVSENQRRIKVNEIKQEQIAEKIVEFAANKFKLNVRDLYNKIYSKISSEYDLIYPFFENVSFGEDDIKRLGLDKDISKEIEDLTKQRIKPVEIKKEGVMEISTYDPEGLEIIKKNVVVPKELEENIKIKYLGGGRYRIEARSYDYKEAEDMMNKTVSIIESAMKKTKSEFSFKAVSN